MGAVYSSQTLHAGMRTPKLKIMITVIRFKDFESY
jgi:hypothetical protein